MICEAIDLGTFDHCEPVIIDIEISNIELKLFETEWKCTFEDGVFGLLGRGHYTFTFDEQKYIFEVI